MANDPTFPPPPPPPPSVSKIEQALIDANAIVAQFIPLVGIIGTGARAIIALLRKSGLNKEAMEFESELATAEAARAALGQAVQDFKTKYPRPDGGPVTT